jgi:hypothetical protein
MSTRLYVSNPPPATPAMFERRLVSVCLALGSAPRKPS